MNPPCTSKPEEEKDNNTQEPSAEEKRYAELQLRALDNARQGATQELQAMLLHGLPVDLCNHQGNTLLMLAAYHNQPETVAMLLKQGATVDQRNDRGQTPLAGAAFKGFTNIVKLLLEAKADPLAPQGVDMNPLRFAILFGQTEVQELIEEHLKKEASKE